MFKDGMQVIINNNTSDHNFPIGQKIYIRKDEECEDGWWLGESCAEHWYVHESEISGIEREQKLIQAFQQIELFNKLIGNKSSYKAVQNQLERVKEELDETFEALENKDNLELLDGVCDQIVVVLDLIAKLEALGYNVLDGLLAVTENNMSKFTKERIVAEYTQRHYEEELDTPCTIAYNEEHELYGVRRVEDGKLLKKINYVSVDLKEFLPKGE